MGFPAIIGALLTVAGTAASMKANADAKSNMEKTGRAELNRQEVFRKKAQAQVDGGLGESGADAAAAKIAQQGGEQRQQYESLARMPLSTASPIVAGNDNAVVSTREGSAIRLSDKVRSKLAGYGGWQHATAMRNADNAQQLGLLSTMAQRSQQVLPIEMTAASHSADNLKGIGSLLSTLGSVVGVGGSMLGGGATGVGGATAAQQSALQAGMGPLNTSTAAANMGASTAMNNMRFGQLLNGMVTGGF